MDQSTSQQKDPAGPVSTGDRALLRLRGVIKRFPGVVAVNQVDFDLRAGEVHVLFGENGSGKSTLVNVISGTYPRDGGTIEYLGEQIASWSPLKARAAGISPVFQEFSLVPDLTVEQNLFLGRERNRFGVLQKQHMREEGRQALAGLDFKVDPDAKVGRLSRANQQMTEIAKALMQDVKVLILDEPTASLTERETASLFKLIERLKQKGVGIIYVSHRMAEIRQVGDRITVLRDGNKIATFDSAQVSDKELVEVMTGRKIGMLFPKINHHPKGVALEVKGMRAGDRLHQVDLYLRSGEIVGMAGLAGAGKSAVVRAIFGLLRSTQGCVVHRGEQISNPRPADMLSRGIFYLPSDRATEGVAMPRPVKENISMAALDTPLFSNKGLLKLGREKRQLEKLSSRLTVRPQNPDMVVRLLSGGNQQKVLLLRGLTRGATVFLFDDPTVGIDVGAKKEVYQFLKALVEEEEAAILLVSSELPELLNLCNRLYVASRGSLVAEFCGDDITEENVLRAFFRVDETSPAMDRKPVQEIEKVS